MANRALLVAKSFYVSLGTICFLIFFLLGPMSRPSFGQPLVKEPNVSGQFYESNPAQLSQTLDRYFQSAQNLPSDKDVKIIIAPHAGYVYSGPVAAYSFKSISQKKYSTFVVLAPSHFFPLDGVSIWKEGAFKTPLGTIEVDRELAVQIQSQNEKFYFEPKVFEKEHALEVELPFLQKVAKDFKIVPIIIGQPSFQTLQALAQAINKAVGDRNDVLLVVSTDMSHYHDGKTAKQMDGRAIEAIKNFDAVSVFKEGFTREHFEMCGFMPVTAALLYAKIKGINHVDLLARATSGDVTGDQSSVVGYTSFIFYKDKDESNQSKDISQGNRVAPLTDDQKKRLLSIARQTIEGVVRNGKKLEVKEDDPRLNATEGAFVTIRNKGELRGCIGNIIGRQPLVQTVRDMAIVAARDDTRFTPVRPDELSDIDVEISVLSQPWQTRDVNDIQLGVHGVIVAQGENQGVFLPQVADETNWSKEEFLAQLCVQKAHLPAQCWKDPRTSIFLFTAQVFGEHPTK